MRIIFLLSGFFLFQTVIAQTDKPFLCGTEHLEDLKQEMLTNRETFKNHLFQRGAINYLPVKIFLVAFNDGSGKIPVANALRMVCQLNKAYADIEIQFYIKEIRQLNNSTITETPRSSGGTLQMQLNKDARAINIFITHQILDGVAGYYIGPAGSNNDFIVIQKDYMADVRVAPHEVGHYLSLPHTFHGWDADAWDPEKHGNPVQRFAPDGITINEFADSSNCGPKNVGDGFCDTPADYNFGANSCSYSLKAMDPNGKLVNPQTNNMMNYFFGCSNYIFTPQQKLAILSSYNSTARRDIRGTSPSDVSVITQMAKLLSPAKGASTASADSVLLDWEDVPGATSYLVQYDIVPTFEVFVQSFVTKESNLKIFGLTLNRVYHWRVIPFNDYSTCFSDASIFTFKAGALTAVKDIPQVKSFSIFPNPLKNNQTLQISLDNRSGFTGSMAVFDLHGRLVIKMPEEHYQAGLLNRTLDLSGLLPGVYSFVLTSRNGRASRKLIVL